MGVLSWVIAGDVGLAGLPVALDPRQRRRTRVTVELDPLPRRARHAGAAGGTRAIFSGELGGDAATHFPWAWKASEQIALRSVAIDVEHTRRRQRLLIRDHVSVRIRDRYPGAETVTCVIPGHDREGEEFITDRLTVSDEALAFSYSGVADTRPRFTTPTSH